jgi:serine/threonine-protein kinase
MQRPPPPPRGPQRAVYETPTQERGAAARGGEAVYAALPALGPALGAGATVGGKYRLDRRLARGGMGSVWRAWDQALERTVAIKFMAQHIAADPRLRDRFNREARAAARLRTPHVVQIYEHGLHQDTPFMVMELLEGEDLQACLKREGRLSLERAAALAMQAAKGLRAAHEAGIVHRDLKPQNVFLAIQSGDEIVKILDFGVAKVHGAEMHVGDATRAGEVLGSPHYMSPEQARGLGDIDHRSDIWSLGVILYQMVTGQLPFAGDTIGNVIVKICSDPLPIPTALFPFLPAAMDGFFARAFAREREQRFTTAVELGAAFAQASGPMALAAVGGPHVTPVPGATPAPGWPLAALAGNTPTQGIASPSTPHGGQGAMRTPMPSTPGVDTPGAWHPAQVTPPPGAFPGQPPAHTPASGGSVPGVVAADAAGPMDERAVRPARRRGVGAAVAASVTLVLIGAAIGFVLLTGDKRSSSDAASPTPATAVDLARAGEQPPPVATASRADAPERATAAAEVPSAPPADAPRGPVAAAPAKPPAPPAPTASASPKTAAKSAGKGGPTTGDWGY